MAERYIWISRWEDFQHYQPERDRAPAWLKTYTKQLDDSRYLELTWPQRAILHDLRSAFARAHGRLPSDHRALTYRLGGRVTSAQLEALNDAGFIEFCSRGTLERRLEKLYSSRAPARSRRSKKLEVEKDKELVAVDVGVEDAGAPEANGTATATIHQMRKDTIDKSLAQAPRKEPL